MGAGGVTVYRKGAKPTTAKKGPVDLGELTSTTR
jgi:hypothetical protein